MVTGNRRLPLEFCREMAKAWRKTTRWPIITFGLQRSKVAKRLLHCWQMTSEQLSAKLDPVQVQELDQEANDWVQKAQSFA